MKVLFGPAVIPEAAGELQLPIHQLSPTRRLQILETMSVFNAKVLEGEASVEAAPVLEEDPAAESPAESRR